MSQFEFINKRRESIPNDTKIFIKKSFDIIERLHELMEDQNISQKDLAERMGKSEAEVSKWINGVQNFTIKTLSKLEAVLGEEIIHVPCKRNLHTTSLLQFRNYNNLISLSTVSKKNFCKIDFLDNIHIISDNTINFNTYLRWSGGTKKEDKSLKAIGKGERIAWKKVNIESGSREVAEFQDEKLEETNIGV